jgi:microcystin-dependent protein
VDYEALFNVLTFNITGTLTTGTKNITISSTANLYVGEKIEGTGIPIGTTISSITDGTTFVISNNASITGSTSILVIPYGSLTPTTFKIPNLCGKTIFGSSFSDSNFKAGMNGGSQNVTLLEKNLPPHSHSYSAHWSENGGWNNGQVQMTDRGWNGNNYTGNGNGTSTPFSVLNPYTVLNYIIKY